MSDIAPQFKVDKSDIVRHIYELGEINNKPRHNMEINAHSYNLGIDEYQNQNYREAIRHLDNAIKKNPWMNFSRAYLIRANCYLSLNENQKALEDFILAEKNIKDEFNLYFNRGIIYQGNEEYEKAESDFKNALRLNPEYESTYIKLLNIYRELNATEKGIEISTQIISKFPSNEIYKWRAKLHKQNNDELKAYFDYKNALKYNATDVNCYENIATISSSMQNYDEAIENYSKCIQFADFKGIYYYNRGLNKKRNNSLLGYVEDIQLSAINGFEEFAEKEKKNNPQYFNM